MPELTEPFASNADLENRLGITLGPQDKPRADSLLLAASRLIQDEARQFIGRVEDDVVTLRGTPLERLHLPERPVVSVSAVSINGTSLSLGDWYVDGNELVRMPAAWLDDSLDALGRGFGWPSQTLEVTYTHGYDADSMPGIVKAVCLEAVVRVWVNPGAVSMENVSGVAVGYAEQRGLLLTDPERRALRRFFGRRARSITIGG